MDDSVRRRVSPGTSAPLRGRGEGGGRGKVEGFSMLELLLVIGIIVIVMTLLAPAASSIGRANSLTAATQSFIAQINRARQEALSRNRSVEFQLLSAAREAGDTAAYRAVRYITCDEGGASSGGTALTNKTVWLPQGVIITTNPARSDLSPALSPTNVTLPGGISATGVFFRIRPNGMISTNINGMPSIATTLQWTLTSERGQPNNFSTIQIDTRTGITRLFRP